MRKTTVIWLPLFLVMLGTEPLARAETPSEIFAQKLVDQIAAKHPEVNVIGLHVTPFNSTDNIIVAINPAGKVGKKSDPDDLDVMRTGKPVVERRDDKGIFDLKLPLLDGPGKTIGMVVIEIKYSYEKQASGALKRAKTVRDELRRQIPSKTKLFEPAA
jgi:hypothetical protein